MWCNKMPLNVRFKMYNYIIEYMYMFFTHIHFEPMEFDFSIFHKSREGTLHKIKLVKVHIWAVMFCFVFRAKKYELKFWLQKKCTYLLN